jgi:signal transduction histidine kinase
VCRMSSFGSQRYFLVLALLLLPVSPWAAGASKRVLLLDSYGRNVAPFSNVISIIRTELSSQSPAPIDLHEVSLEAARFAKPEQEVPFVNFLKERFSEHPADLVVAVGGPAFQFLARHREYLFAASPVLITGVAEQPLRTAALPRNAAVVPLRIHLRGLIEDILQVLPDTADIAVIFGDSQLETFWLNECQRAFEDFSGRVHFTYLTHLTFDEIKRRSADLTPGSVLFFGLLVVDAAGTPFDPSEAIQGILAVAKVPLFSLHESFFGFGTVGGRLIQERASALQATEVALRILQGESPAALAIPPEPRAVPVYDWRALQRWGINESRLPRGSSIYFRQPSFWELYRWQILGALGLLIVQALLIARLLVQKRSRERAERELVKSEQESRRLQDELLHAGRISTMGELAGALAHEINQPLSAIMSNAQAATRYLALPQPDLQEVREILIDIAKEDARAGDVISRLRAFLKKKKTEFGLFDLNSIFQEVLGLLYSDAVIREVVIATEFDPRLPSVVGDRIQLQQVALNLMLNAFEAMTTCAPAERRVMIRTEWKDTQILAAITDNGNGISSDEAEKIFKPFYTSKPQGLGMGLAICRSIINNHQGRLWVENNPDRGATFFFTLPTATEAHAWRRS